MTIVAYPATADQADLPPVPPTLFALLALYLEPLLTWLSDQFCARMLREEADHPLVQLAQHYDLQPVIAQCAAYHHASGRMLRSA
jgi:hypothetical protein